MAERKPKPLSKAKPRATPTKREPRRDWNRKPKPLASIAQIRYLRSMGVEPPLNITVKQAQKLIDRTRQKGWERKGRHDLDQVE